MVPIVPAVRSLHIAGVHLDPQAAEARHRAYRSKLDETESLGEDRAALSAQLQGLIDAAAWVKKKT